MNCSNRFVELDRTTHDRASFDCGEAPLNEFLKTQAARHLEAGLNKTRVLPATEPGDHGRYPICAFFSVTVGSIERDTLPKALAKRLPRYPVPVFLIAQLAVDTTQKGKGLGKITLVNALQYLCRVHQNLPAFAIIVECLNDAAEQFYTHFGFQPLCVINGKSRLFLPMKTAQQLFGPERAEAVRTRPLAGQGSTQSRGND